MKLNMIFVKFNQKIKSLKNLNFGVLRFFRFLKNLNKKALLSQRLPRDAPYIYL